MEPLIPTANSPRHDVVLVAMLLAQGESQKQISILLQKDPSWVNRMAKQAEEMSLLKVRYPDFDKSKVDSATYAATKQELEKLKSTLPLDETRRKLIGEFEKISRVTGLPVPREVHLTPTPTARFSQENWKIRIQEIGEFAARQFIEYYTDRAKTVRNIGLLWGKSIKSFVVAVAEQMRHIQQVTPERLHVPRERGDKLVVPLTGPPSFLAADAKGLLNYPVPDPTVLPSTLADQLAVSLRTDGGRDEKGDCSSVFYPPVPALLPDGEKTDHEKAAEERILRSFFQRMVDYKRIFGPDAGKQGPLIERLDTIITSVGHKPATSRGPNHDYADPWLAERFSVAGDEERKLWSVVIGDLGGVLIASDKQGQELLKGMNERLLGAKLAHYQACAIRATKSKGHKLGVVLIAHSKHKAPVIRRAIFEGCVNVLICDTECAEELLSIISNWG